MGAITSHWVAPAAPTEQPEPLVAEEPAKPRRGRKPKASAAPTIDPVTGVISESPRAKAAKTKAPKAKKAKDASKQSEFLALPSWMKRREKAADSFRPVSSVFIEQDIGKEAHIQRAMPLFLTLRNQDGEALVTAMLPPRGQAGGSCIIVGPGNADPYPDHGDAIRALGEHFGLTLDRATCFPYRR